MIVLLEFGSRTKPSVNISLTESSFVGLSAQQRLDAKVSAVALLEQADLFAIKPGILTRARSIKARRTPQEDWQYPRPEGLQMETGSMLHVVHTGNKAHVQLGEYVVSPRFGFCHAVMIHGENGVGFYHIVSGNTNQIDTVITSEETQRIGDIQQVDIISRDEQLVGEIIQGIQAKGITAPVLTHIIEASQSGRFRVWGYVSPQNKFVFRVTTDTTANKPISLQTASIAGGR